MKKVGCLGGTFDPIHNGHLELAKTVRKQCGLDEIWFLPTKDTPLKSRTISSFSTRKKMIDLAIKPYRKFRCCEIENKLPTPSYTIQTVKELQKIYPDIEFYWIVGDDQVAQFDQWKSIDELLSLVQFIVVPRQQFKIQDKRLWVCSTFHHDASSTAVREGSYYYLPSSVRNYVLMNELYLKSIVRKHCSEKRTQHVLSMTELCIKLAVKHHVSVHEATMAGMLHDVCKEMGVEQNKKWISHFYPSLINVAPAIYHSFTVVPWIKQNLGYTNQRVLNAIYNHTLGLGKSKLAKIVYIADKIDPSRGYDISKQLACAMNNLDEGMELIKREQQEYLKKEGVHV